MSDLLTASATPTLKPRDFRTLQELVYRTAGLELREGKERLVTARLGKVMRSGAFRSFEQYIHYVQSDRTGEGLTALIDALTTNHTTFLREPDHFRFLTTRILPALRQRRSIAIWSAASSTGEEPYSILFSLLDAIEPGTGQEVRVIASDISTKVLRQAREGVYGADKLRAVPPSWIQKYFTALDRTKSEYQVRKEYRSMVEFRRINLMDPLPLASLYPVIFCRNVMIYFDQPTQAGLVKRLATLLEPGGHLMVGHSESLSGLDQPLQYVCPAVYTRS